MATIDELRALGYDVGVAHGDAAAEEELLATLREAQADLPAIDELQAAADAFAAALATMPAGDARNGLEQQLGEMQLTVSSLHDLTDAIAHQERAVEAAHAMPTAYVISGPTISRIYVCVNADGTGCTDNDQATLDSLADPDAHAERSFQADNPDAMAAAVTISGYGFPVDRPDPGADTFVVAGQTKTGRQLVTLAAKLDESPPAARASIPERVAEALVTAPELGDTTRVALEQALKPAPPALP